MHFFQLERYADVHRLLRSSTKTICTPHVYQVAIKAFQETSWKAQYLHSGGQYNILYIWSNIIDKY